MGIIVYGHTNFVGEGSSLPFDSLQENQKWQVNGRSIFLEIAVKTIMSVIAIVNPEIIVVTSEEIKAGTLEKRCNRCREIMHFEHMQNDYINGLISITLEILVHNVPLTEIKI